ncbi:hypothetical protein KI387_025131, partial [Taxus chinensis]
MALTRSHISSTLPKSAILLTSDAAPKFSALKTLKFSILFKTLKLRAGGTESFETKETRGRNSKESIAPSKQSVLQSEEDLLSKVSTAKDAEEVLCIIADKFEGIGGGIVSSEDCAAIISAAIARNNVDLAFSILHGMRRTSIQKKLERKLGEGSLRDSSTQKWIWAQPDVTTYITLVRGLAASLRVSDAIRTIKDISRAGAPQGNEVPFGKVVKCPNCMIALAVVQPQHGVQVASNSSAERNWSTYSFIHSAKRNKLGSKKAEDLVLYLVQSAVTNTSLCLVTSLLLSQNQSGYAHWRTQHKHFSNGKGAEIPEDKYQTSEKSR